MFLSKSYWQHRPASKFDNEVRGIYYDNKDRLWLGVKNGRLYVYQQGKLLSNLFDNEPPEGLGLIYSIMQDSKGNIWLGTKANGLFKAEPINREQTKFHLVHFLASNNNTDLPCNEIYSLLEDKQERIWIGSYDNGLYLLQEEPGNIKFIAAGELYRNYPKDVFHKIRHMALDAAGNLWLGTTNGLLLLNMNATKANQFHHTPLIEKYQAIAKALATTTFNSFIAMQRTVCGWLHRAAGFAVQPVINLSIVYSSGIILPGMVCPTIMC